MFITDRAAAAIPALKNADEHGRRQALADADRIYKHVRRHEWIDETELRAYGERNSISPDRFNTALDLLKQSGRLLHIPEHDE